MKLSRGTHLVVTEAFLETNGAGQLLVNGVTGHVRESDYPSANATNAQQIVRRFESWR
jgi:hypothetical protein